MRKILSISIITLLFMAIALPVAAHDGWSQTNSPILEIGEVSYIELLFGNHSNEHASYRIDGTWNPDNTSVYVIPPAAEKVNITDTLFYTGELAEVSEERLGVNNYYIASFSSARPGIYIISVEGDSIFKHGDVASRTLRSAKSFVAYSEIPTVSQVRKFSGFDQQVSVDRAELVPLFNPAAVTPGEQVSVQLLLKGEPLPNTEISLIRRSNSDAERLTTDENGIIYFATGPADYYLLRAKPSTDEKVEGEYDKINYEATMTFTVQNGKSLNSGQFGMFIHAANPFVYTTLVIGIGFVASLIYAFRKKRI